MDEMAAEALDILLERIGRDAMEFGSVVQVLTGMPITGG